MNCRKYKIGYTQGTFDMFHMGHLNLLKHAKEKCEYLIVGVNKDKLVQEYKCKTPIIHENERLEIIKSIKFTDDAMLVSTLDKCILHDTIGYDVIFIGDDWKGNIRWNETERRLKTIGVDVVYLKYTKGICSTDLRKKSDKKINACEDIC